MGRIMGLSWIFCVKRVYGFSFQKLRFFQRKVLRTLQKIRSNSTKCFRILVASRPHHTLNKKDSNKSHCLFYGADNGTVLLGGVKRVCGCRLLWRCHLVVKPSPSAASRSNLNQASLGGVLQNSSAQQYKTDPDKSRSLFYGADNGTRTHVYRNHNPGP